MAMLWGTNFAIGISTTFLILTLFGCAGGRPALPPDSRVSAPATWRDGDRAQSPAMEGTWWRQFGDDTLNRIVDQAILGNDDRRIAIARVAEARGALSLARAALAPHIGVEV